MFTHATYVARHKVSRQEVAAARKVGKTIKRWLLAYGGKSKDVNEFSSRVVVVILTKGRAGAADYLKRVGDCIKQYLAYQKVDAHTGVKLKKGLPGIIPESFRGDETVLSRLTKVYRAIEVLEVPRDGVEKLVKSIHTPAIARDEEAWMLVRHAIKRGWESIGSPTVSNMGNPPLAISPEWVLDGGSWRCITSDEFREVLLSDIKFAAVNLTHSKTHTVFGLKHPDDLFKIASECEESPVDGIAGKYSFTLEAGGKVRGFFSPRQCIQALSTPILKAVAGIRDTIPEDCNTDQLKGVKVVQGWLSEGLRCHSVDQSAATDRFPFDLQAFACDLIGLPSEDISFMRQVSRMPFQCTEKAIRAGFPETVRLEVGQPMGTKFSIAVYGLTMALLLRGLCLHAGIATDRFVVLNDDVVICDECVAYDFISLMQRVGVEINISKSWSSQHYAEFAGHSISRSGAVVGGKWQEVTPANILSYVSKMPNWLFNRFGVRKRIEMFHHLHWGHPVVPTVTVKEAVQVNKAVEAFLMDTSLFDRYFCSNYAERESYSVVVGQLLRWLARTYGVTVERSPDVNLERVLTCMYQAFPEVQQRVRQEQWVGHVLCELTDKLSSYSERAWQEETVMLIGFYAAAWRNSFDLDVPDVMQRLHTAVRAVEEQLWYPMAKPDGIKNSVQGFYMAHRYLSSVG